MFVGVTLGVWGKGMKNCVVFLTWHHILSAAVTMQEMKSGCSLVTPDLGWLGFPGALNLLLAKDTLSNTTCHGKFLSMPWHFILPASEPILAVAFFLPSQTVSFSKLPWIAALDGLVLQHNFISLELWPHHGLFLSVFPKPFLMLRSPVWSLTHWSKHYRKPWAQL